MSGLREELFRLLPRVYQQRDAEAGQANVLKELLEVLGAQADAVAADLGQLYDDWFIETCADWVVPYLGDLLGVRLLHPIGPGAGRSRALVANTLRHRQRKGTVAGLEQVAFDVTGWPTAAVEYFARLGVTQHLAHPRPVNVRTPDLRRPGDLELVGGPFSAAAHTGEARRLPSGRYGIGNIGIHVWRLEAQRMPRTTARPVADPPDGRYLVDPTGRPVPLFNPGATEAGIASLAREHHVPERLRRRALYDELEAIRAGRGTEPRWFGDDPVVEVFADLGSGLRAIPVTEMTAADLSDPPVAPPSRWPRPAAPVTVAVDPVLGRLAFRADLAPTAVEVTTTYGAPGRIGAGPYDRTHPKTTDLLHRATWFRAVGQRATPVVGAVVTTLADAVAEWNTLPAGAVGVVAVLDSRTYEEALTGGRAVTVPAGSQLLLLSVAWPRAEAGTSPLALDQATPVDRRPHLLGSLEVVGTAGEPGAPAGELTVDGLLVEGDVTVLAGDLGVLALRHTTVVPGVGGVSVAAPGSPDTDNGRLTVEVENSIVGAVVAPAPGPALRVTATIVDGAGGDAVEATDLPVSLDRVTVLGGLTAQQLDASDCVLDGAVTVVRRQSGCLRFSYLTEGAVGPRRYRCQPDLALTDVTDPARVAAIRARLSPVFTSTEYGHPAYGRLDDRSDPGLLAGASTGAAMGAFRDLQEPHRTANLAAVLDEHLRLGLDAGVIHET